MIDMGLFWCYNSVVVDLGSQLWDKRHFGQKHTYLTVEKFKLNYENPLEYPDC
jgi:hypothetical protein